MRMFRRISAICLVLGLISFLVTQSWGDADRNPFSRPIEAGSGTKPVQDDFTKELARTKFSEGGVVTYVTSKGERIFGLPVQPKFDGPKLPIDYLVMVDTSASQAGGPMKAARQFTEKLVKLAGPKDRFSIWVVNSGKATRPLNRSFKPANDKEVADAVAALKKEVPLGDTDLKDGLKKAIEAFELDPNRRQAIVFIGDGMSIHDPITAKDRVELIQQMVKLKISFFPIPAGPHLDPENLHGFASGTGGTVVRIFSTDVYNNLAKGAEMRNSVIERLQQKVATPVLYPKRFELNVDEFYPVALPPVRPDVPTLVIGKGKLDEKLAYAIEGTVNGKEVRVTGAEEVRASEPDNFFLVTMLDQWKNAKDQPALLPADRALAHAQAVNMVARDELLGHAQMAMLLDRLDAAEMLFKQAGRLDPHDPDVKGGLALVQMLRDNRITKEQLQKQLEKKENGKALLIHKTANGKNVIRRDVMKDLLALLQEPQKGNKQAGPQPLAPPQDNDELMKQRKQREAVEEQRIREIVDQALRQARQLMLEGNFEDALGILKRARTGIEDNNELRESFRREIDNRLERAERDIGVQGRRIRQAEEQRLVRIARAQAEIAVFNEREAENERTRARMRNYDDLMNQARYYDAFEAGLAIVRDAVSQGKPVPIAADAAADMGLLTYHLSEVEQLRDERQERYLATMLQVERSHVPFPDEPPVQFPPAAAWKRLTDLRKERYESSGFTEEDPYTLRKIRELKKLLRTPVSIDGFDPGTPLKDALGFISERYNVTILIDSQAFMNDLQIQEPEAQPVKLPRMVNVSLDTILRLLLAQAQGTFIIRRDFIEVTTLQRQAAEKVIRVYPVADLVIPIPNSVNQQAVNQTQQNLFGSTFLQNPTAFTNPFGFGLNPFGIGVNPLGIGVNPLGIGVNPLGIGVNPVNIGANPLGIGVNPLGAIGNPQQTGNGGQLGGQFGLQGGDTSAQLIQLIVQVVGKPEDWAPVQPNIPGAGIGGGALGGGGFGGLGGGFGGGGIGGGLVGVPPAGDPNLGYGDPNQAGSLGYYAPARALVVKGTSRIHTRLGGGLLGPRAPQPGNFNLFNDKPLRDGVLVIRPKGNKPDRVDEQPKVVVKKPAKPRVIPDPKKLWENALLDGVHDPGLIIATADFLAERGHFDHAAEFLKANLREGIVNKPWVYEALSLALKLGKGSTSDIERAELSVMDLQPQDARGYLKASRAMADNKRFDRALAFCRQAALLDPNQPGIYRDALAYAEGARDAEAMAWAAGNLLGQDWPEKNEQLHQDAKAKINALKRLLEKEKRLVVVKQLEESIQRQSERDLVIILEWQGEADLDLIVKEPVGSVCSFLQQKTTGGGTLLGETLTKAEREPWRETYVAAQAFTGEYEITVKRSWGRPIGSKATIKVIEHADSPQEQTILHKTFAFDREYKTTIVLDSGRRTKLADVTPTPVRHKRPAESLPASDEVLQKLRALAEDGNFRGKINVRGDAGGFGTVNAPALPAPAEFFGKPVYQTRARGLVGNGIDVALQPVVSPDKRVVGMRLDPVFQTLDRVKNAPVVRNAVVPGAPQR
ncbi:MAG: hypothetical protein KatS3mg105_2744 [Gemmatales bacterium]|nr:MAG: hypothetical protein KatS3mg105_2744 [Gemmatales bacterium]